MPVQTLTQRFTTPAHPLARTFARGYGRVHGGCHLGARVSARSLAPEIRLDALAADPRHIDVLLDGIGDDVGSSRRDVQASLFLEACAWTLLSPLAGALVSERRVPLLPAGSVAVTQRNGLWPEELRLDGRVFATLADDRDANHPDARVVDDQGALVAVLREQVVGLLREPVAVLAGCSGRAERALWRSVSDRAAAALLSAGESAGDVALAGRLAAALLDGPAPLVGRPDYRRLGGAGGAARVHVRSGCCLWWRTRSASCCLTYPRSAADEVRTAA